MDEATLKAMQDIATHAVEPKEFNMDAGAVLVTRHDHKVHLYDELMDKFRDYPRRPRGTSVHHTLESLIAHAKRHAYAGHNDAAAFVNMLNSPCIEVVYDYHPSDLPDGPAPTRGGWCEHRAHYAFPHSEAWKRWVAAVGKHLPIADFARLLEDGIGDVAHAGVVDKAPVLPGVVYATPTELLALADGLTIHATSKVAEHRRLDNGTAQMVFAEDHVTADRTGAPVKVPNGFLLAIPVFVGGPSYVLPVRLRYRVADRNVAWSIALHNADEAKREAVQEAAAAFTKATGVDTLFGTPDEPTAD